MWTIPKVLVLSNLGLCLVSVNLLRDNFISICFLLTPHDHPEDGDCILQ
jgi:hypothetical protein